MRSLQKGSEGAFNELYERYAAKLYAYFWRALAQEKEVAEDFTQQLFLKLIEKKTSYDLDRTFSTWLYTLAANMVKNEYRRRGRQAKHQTRINFSPGNEEDWIARIDDVFWQERLETALAGLAEKHRQVFLLRYQQELSIRDISGIVGCPEGTVKSRLHYAIQYLARQLDKCKSW